MARDRTLKVTSDVRRDLLAAAAVFKNEAAVVWEYVVNALQYVDRGVQPRVQITVRPRAKSITILDNGRGMDAEDLQHFFRMHGENKDRLRGRPGRGKFGTGKSAAFGIGRVLSVESRRDGLRNAVELTRNMIDASAGDDIPIEWTIRNEATNANNGTTIEIRDVVLPRINAASIIEYIERHLQVFRATNPQVAVNEHVCEYREPAVAEEFTYVPSPDAAAILGEALLTIRVAQSPLPEADQGIVVTAGFGNMVAVERAGVERKEFGSYLFGMVDVPQLEQHASPIEAYDLSRSLSLNPAHPVAAVLIPYIGAKLEEVRQKLVSREKDARRTEQARRLAREADKIADILNRDFDSVRQRLSDIRSASSAAGSARSTFGDAAVAGSDSDDWVKGLSIPGTVERTAKPNDGTGTKPNRKPDVTAAGRPEPSGTDTVDPAGGAGGNRSRPRGGFRVGYKNLGKNEPRSHYDSGTLAILINLDHAVVAAALGDGNVEDPVFRRLSYEIAFSEYALALGYEMTKNDPEMPADDLLYEVRSSLNRVSNAAAALYR